MDWVGRWIEWGDSPETIRWVIYAFLLPNEEKFWCVLFWFWPAFGLLLFLSNAHDMRIPPLLIDISLDHPQSPPLSPPP